MKAFILSLNLVIIFFACGQTPNSSKNLEDTFDGEKFTLTSEEWKSRLSDIEFYVLREKGTERAFTGDLLNVKDAGVYTCAACQLPLFDSKTKFNSGTGWPSFYGTYNDKNVAEKSDTAFGMARVEVQCARCDGHLGHVFPDGPAPTGLRYCINSVSLDFVKKD